MSDSFWAKIGEVTVKAQPEIGFWTIAYDSLESKSKLKFVVEKIKTPQGQQNNQEWTYSENKKCQADGDPKASIDPDKCMMRDAQPGALIGKYGGSIAGINDGDMFIVGSFCVYELPMEKQGEDYKEKIGALYLTMNTDPHSNQKRDGQISVLIYRMAKAG